MAITVAYVASMATSLDAFDLEVIAERVDRLTRLVEELTAQRAEERIGTLVEQQLHTRAYIVTATGSTQQRQQRRHPVEFGACQRSVGGE